MATMETANVLTSLAQMKTKPVTRRKNTALRMLTSHRRDARRFNSSA